MKGNKLIFIIILIFLVGCAPSKQMYNLRPGGTQNDFNTDNVQCSNYAGLGGGGFIFGPIWLVVPVSAIYAANEQSKMNKFQECMEARGHECIKNCKGSQPKE